MLKSENTVRVFLSSTFRDMNEERDYLIKFVFPELRARCRAQGLEFSEVDLRWGVTEEQAVKGEVLPICLAEIDRCHPYFVGILGQRYGHVPERIQEELIDAQPWLVDHKNDSITALEILHGALRANVATTRCFFYFRDPAYLDQLSPESRADYLPESLNSEAKLEDLKVRIRQSPHIVRENYSDPKALGDMIIGDLWKSISQDFPTTGDINPLESQSAAHVSLAHSKGRVYIGGRTYMERLNDYADHGGFPLVVLGESGIGKSALLANWLLKRPKTHPNDFVFYHFVGCSPESTDYRNLTIRLLSELKQTFHFSDAVPADLSKQKEILPLWLARAGASDRRVIIILDGLNQIEDTDNAQDLGWLPEYLPPQVRLIVSTLPGRCLSELERRGCQQATIESMTPDEKHQLISQYLRQYGKSLSQSRTDRIASAPQAANPLYLRTLLDELRIFGIYEQLDDRINHFLSATSIPELFDLTLERYEQDYEQNRPGLVGDTMSLLWASRLGIPEAELMALLGTPEQPLSKAFWSPFYLATEQNIVNRAGLLGFSHDFLRQAVKSRYLTEPETVRQVHQVLARHFSTLEMSDRKVAEVPYQYYRAGDDESLKSCLVNPDFLCTAVETNNRLADFGQYWRHLETQYNIVDSHIATMKGLKQLSKANSYLAFLDAAAKLFEHLGKYADVQIFLAELFNGYGKIQAPMGIRLNISNRLASILLKQNKYGLAFRQLKKYYGLVFQGDDSITLDTADYHITMAGLYTEMGDFRKARFMYNRAERFIKAIPKPPIEIVVAGLIIRTSLSILAAAYGFDMAFHSDSTAYGGDPLPLAINTIGFIRTHLGSQHPNCGVALRHLAWAHQLTDEKEKALAAAAKSVAVLELILGRKHPETGKSLVSLGNIHFMMGNYKEAEVSLSAGRHALRGQSTTTLDYARALSGLAKTYRATARNRLAEKLELEIIRIRDVFKQQKGLMRMSYFDARVSSRTGKIDRILASNLKKISYVIKTFIEKVGYHIAALISIFVTLGIAVICLGPLSRIFESKNMPGFFSLFLTLAGHWFYIWTLILCQDFFGMLMGEPDTNTFRFYVLRAFSYVCYAGSFLLLRDYWKIIPDTTTSAVVIIMGILLFLPSVLISIFPFLVPKSVRDSTATALISIFPFLAHKSVRDSTATAEMGGPMTGGRQLPLHSELAVVEGLSTYEKQPSSIEKESSAANIMESRPNFNRWAVIRAGLLVPTFILFLKLSQFTPEETAPAIKKVFAIALLFITLYFFLHGIQSARKSAAIFKMLLTELLITLSAASVFMIVIRQFTMKAIFFVSLLFCFLTVLALAGYGITKLVRFLQNYIQKVE